MDKSLLIEDFEDQEEEILARNEAKIIVDSLTDDEKDYFLSSSAEELTDYDEVVCKYIDYYILQWFKAQTTHPHRAKNVWNNWVQSIANYKKESESIDIELKDEDLVDTTFDKAKKSIDRIIKWLNS
jgi:hypothetical protein